MRGGNNSYPSEFSLSWNDNWCIDINFHKGAREIGGGGAEKKFQTVRGMFGKYLVNGSRCNRNRERCERGVF